MLNRRDFVGIGAAAAALATEGGASAARSPVPKPSRTVARRAPGTADHTIRITTGLVELGPDTIVSTTTYNGQFPGPLLRLTEGKMVSVDIHNETDRPEQLHWHGQTLPVEVDGSAEEGTPYIPAHGSRRIAFTPGPSGFRFYHSHVAAKKDLSAGLYSGQAGLVFIEPRRHDGAYDREVFIVLKEFAPVFTRTEMPDDFLFPNTIVPALQAQALKDLDASTKRYLPQGFEVGYNYYSINGRMLGQGAPVRVKRGERVLFHILNASATEIRSLALPGHSFRVLALDGNEVAKPAAVPVLWLGPAERISALVTMNEPGVWIMGDLDDDARARGMGIVVEYAGERGPAKWSKQNDVKWNYLQFGQPKAPSQKPDETLALTFSAHPGAIDGFDQFLVNGIPFSMKNMEPMFRLVHGRRYRLVLRNATDDTHPVHLHRHSFELSSFAGRPTSGIVKDVVMIGGFQEATVDFTASQPGLSLFHCHMQHHMDYGFMALFDCA